MVFSSKMSSISATMRARAWRRAAAGQPLLCMHVDETLRIELLRQFRHIVLGWLVVEDIAHRPYVARALFKLLFELRDALVLVHAMNHFEVPTAETAALD